MQLGEICKVIQDEARLTKGTKSMRVQRSFAVKQSINPILDIPIKGFVIGLSRDHNIINLRPLESSTKGCYLQFVLPGRVTQLRELPNYFLNVHKPRNLVFHQLEQSYCHVHAEVTTVRLVNRIFARICNVDNLEGSASIFALDMTEANYILENVSDKSLVIIDELGRSTSIEEGTAISWAILERLMKHNAVVLFATHFLFLTKMEWVYLNGLNYKLETMESSALQLNYTHEFKRGVTDLEYYGLKLTQNSSYPTDVVEKAKELAKSIITGRQRDSRFGQEDGSPDRKQKYLLASHLRLLAKAHAKEPLRPDILGFYLKSLQEEFNSLTI